ncbi:MAG: hypothetical protein ACJ8IR_03140 [Alphaproteobacteria bacterium]|jgi:hypothetical protein
MNRRASLFVTASAVALAFAALGSSPAAAGISTYGSWDGSSYVQPFGCPDTTTYGTIITIPKGKTHLGKFHFSWINLTSGGSMVVRGEVYAWDGAKATGSALYESGPKKVSFSDGLFHKVGFKATLVPVTPGAQYVIFASIDKDYEKCTNSYEVGWGYIGSDVYPGGGFVYQNNAGDENQWTATPWNTFGGADIAFKVATSP